MERDLINTVMMEMEQDAIVKSVTLDQLLMIKYDATTGTRKIVGLKDWDLAAWLIVSELNLCLYNSMIPVGFIDGKYKVITNNLQNVITGHIAKKRLNIPPGFVKQIADAVVNAMPNFEPNLEDNVIYFNNGEYNIVSGKFTKKVSSGYNHRKIDRDYIEQTADPLAFKRLTEWASLYGDATMVKQIFEMFAAVIVPTNVFRKMFELYGKGKNGKSLMMEVLMTAIGKEKVSTQELENLTSTRNFDRLPLVNKMVNVIDDLDRVNNKGAGKLKTLSAGNVLTAEIKGGAHLSFKNEATIIFGTNNHLDVGDKGASTAINDRLQIINFTRKFKNTDKLRTEADLCSDEEMLNALVSVSAAAAHSLYVNGKKFTKSITTKEAEEEQKMDTDVVYAWLEEGSGKELFTEQTLVGVNKTYDLFKSWCKHSNRYPIHSTHFGRAISKYFPETKRVRRRNENGQRHYYYENVIQPWEHEVVEND